MIQAAAAQASAQEPGLSLSPGNAENGWRAAVQPVQLLSDSALIRPLLSGLPLRFHFQIELWHDKFLADGIVTRAAWTLILFQEPLSGEFNLSRDWDDRDEWFATVAAAAQALERVYLSPLAGPSPNSGRYYYEARLEVEVLSLGDLDELGHWLRGEVVEEEGSDVGSTVTRAVGRGLKRLFIRLIGMSARSYQARTELFSP